MGWLKIVVGILVCNQILGQYQPNWQSLDTRPLPLWYDEAKFGIFTHWGVYSVPSFGDEWFWYNWKGRPPNETKEFDEFMYTHYRPNTTYADFARSFTAIDFNATQFAEIIKSSGAKYFVLTTKHHEGFTLWPSNVSWNWNAKDLGPARDLVGEIRDAILKVGNIHWGTYFSLFEWFNPIYLNDKKNNKTSYSNLISYPQLIDLVTNYQPDIVWSDGDWEMGPEYWRSQEFLAWLYNESPVKDTVVTNDRWGNNVSCHHGGYYTCTDHFDPGILQPHKWEDCDTVDKYSWGFRRTMTLDDVVTLQYFITRLARTISTGGNLLMNIGPDHNGRVIPIFEERLRDIGLFVNANSEAIFATKPWIWQNDSDSTVWYTSQVRNNATLDPYRLYNNQTQLNTIIYAFVCQWPDDNKVSLARVNATANTTVNLFGTKGLFIPLNYTQPFNLSGGILVDISRVAVALFPNKVSFVLKIEYAADQAAPPGLGQPTPAPPIPSTSISSSAPQNLNTTTSQQNNGSPQSTPSTSSLSTGSTQTPGSAMKHSSNLIGILGVFFFLVFMQI